MTGGISGSGARPSTAAADTEELPWGANPLKPAWTVEVEPKPCPAGLVVGAWPAGPAAWELEAVAAVAAVAFVAAAVWVVPVALPVAAEPAPVCVRVPGPEEGTEPRTPSLTTRGGAAEGLRWVPWLSNQRHLTGQGRREGQRVGIHGYIEGHLPPYSNQRPRPWYPLTSSPPPCPPCIATTAHRPLVLHVCTHRHYPPPPPYSPPPSPPPVPSALDAKP